MNFFIVLISSKRRYFSPRVACQSPPYSLALVSQNFFISLIRASMPELPFLIVFECLSYSCNYIRNMIFPQFSRNRQTYYLPTNPHRIWVIFRLPSKCLLVIGMFRDAQVMNSNTDILGCHGIHEDISGYSCFLFVNQDSIEMISMTGLRLWIGWQDNRQVSKCFIIAVPNFLSSQPVFLHPFQLMNANSSMDVHHIIFKAAFYDLIMFVSFVAEPFPCIFAHTVQP